MKRWKNHVHASKAAGGGRWHFPNAIRKYGPDAFDHDVLAVCDSLEAANAAEEYWIERLDTTNPERGFNLVKGGKHVPVSPEKRPWDRPEFRAAVTAGVTAKWEDPEYRARMSESSREVNARPGVKEKIVESLKARVFSEETRQKISSNVRGKKRSPEVVARVAEATRHRSPETRAKTSTSSKANWADPEFRSRHSASSRSRHPDVVAKISASLMGCNISEEARQKLLDHHRKLRELHPDHATHFRCRRHGSVPFADCFVFRAKGRQRFRCKLCVKETRLV